MSKRPKAFINSLKIGEMYNAIRHKNVEAVHRLADVVDLTTHGNSVLRCAIASGNQQIIECVFPKAQWEHEGELLILAAATQNQYVYNLVHVYSDYSSALAQLDSPPFGSDWKQNVPVLRPLLEEMENEFQRQVIAQNVNETDAPLRRKSKM